MPWAKETLNNYLSDTIKNVVQTEVVSNPDKSKMYKEPRIYNNLLSSQPLCFNLFAELQQDLELATKVIRKLCPDRVDIVTSVKYEHSPGRGQMEYTGDHSAFDVYLEFLNPSGAKGFIGIEVKYHENLIVKPAKMKDRYFKVASEMGCFKDDCLDKLKSPPLEQIWRDHLLAGSLLNAGDGFADGFFVLLSPKENPHCKEAIQEYMKCLTDRRSFESWTLEKVVMVIRQYTDKSWINDLHGRYLDFSKIDDLLHISSKQRSQEQRT